MIATQRITVIGVTDVSTVPYSLYSCTAELGPVSRYRERPGPLELPPREPQVPSLRPDIPLANPQLTAPCLAVLCRAQDVRLYSEIAT
jgi:hypothetical protein